MDVRQGRWILGVKEPFLGTCSSHIFVGAIATLHEFSPAMILQISIV